MRGFDGSTLAWSSQQILKISLALLLACPSWATTTSGLTYHGRVLKPDGTALESSNVQFRLQIRTPGAENCLMYEEVRSLNMRNSGGIFELTMNDGAGTRADSTGLTMDRVLGNRGGFSLSPTTCDSGAGTWTPNDSDGRRIQVFFRDENMTSWEPLPSQGLNFVPMAIEAKQIGGFTAKSLLRVEEASGPQNVASLSVAQFNELNALAALTSTNYMRSSSQGAYMPTRSGTPPTPSVGQFWFDTTSSQLKFYDGSAVQSLGAGAASLPSLGSGQIWIGNSSNVATSAAISGDATLTSGGVLALKAVGTAGTYVKVTTDAGGRVTSGSVSLTEADLPSLTTAGKVSGGALSSGTIGGSTAWNTSGSIATTSTISAANVTSTSMSAQSFRVFNGANTHYTAITVPSALSTDFAFVLPQSSGSSGNVLTTDGAGVLSWSPASTGSVTSVTGTAPISVSGSATTPNLSMAAASSSANGYLSNTDWTTFNNKLGSALPSGSIFVGNGSGVATGVTLSGDVTITNAGVVTVGKIQNRTVASTAPVTAQYLRYNTATTTWESQYINIVDLKKSDGTTQFQSASCAAGQTLTWSLITDLFTCTTISISKSQISDLGTIGTAAAKNFGAAAGNLVELDGSGKIPTGLLPASSSLTGSGSANYIPKFTGSTVQANSLLFDSGTKLGVGTSSPGEVLDVNGSVNVSYGAYLKSNGVGYANSIMLGTYWDGTSDHLTVQPAGNSASVISFLTATSSAVAATEKVTILSSGNVGIGTTTPGQKLSVAGTIETTVGGIKFPDGTVQTSATGATNVSPAGFVGAFSTTSCPTGWLEANGAPVSRTTYASLFSAIATMYGAGDGTTTFNLPDYRGYFLRGWNHSAASDPNAATRTNRGDGTTGDAVGTKQSSIYSSHTHSVTDPGHRHSVDGSVWENSPSGGEGYQGFVNVGSNVYFSDHSNPVQNSYTGISVTSSGGSETRPINANVIYCVSTATSPVTTTASSGSGTAGYLPVWTNTTALGSSPVAVSGGNVGIGTTTPSATLDVNGTIRPGAVAANGACAPEGAFGYDSALHSPMFCNGSGKWQPTLPYVIVAPQLSGSGTITTGNVCPSTTVTIPVGGKYQIAGTWEVGSLSGYMACTPVIGGSGLSTGMDGWGGIMGSGNYVSGHINGVVTLSSGSNTIQWTCNASGGASGTPECQRWSVKLTGPTN